MNQSLLSGLEGMAGTTGLEPAASAVTGQRSNQLNYVPNLILIVPKVFRAPGVSRALARKSTKAGIISRNYAQVAKQIMALKRPDSRITAETSLPRRFRQQ